MILSKREKQKSAPTGDENEQKVVATAVWTCRTVDFLGNQERMSDIKKTKNPCILNQQHVQNGDTPVATSF